MRRRGLSPIKLVLALLLLASLACNLGKQAQPTATPVPPTQQPTSTVSPAETAVATAALEPSAEPRTLAVSSMEEVRLATIQIEAEGSFVDPQVGLQLNVAGSGSGFIIAESGLAVTNNHVVTGAALLRVWVGGESRPRNARVLGVSECSDLAVIDIEGDGYRYLEWYDGSLTAGLGVYAAGFPLGDPEFTLTGGIVSKERADGETDWASVDAVIQHDATINPGNSGGPLVTAEGRIVGINYASSPSYNQYFAIARDEALKIIDQLRAGEDVTSIGVNGVAVNDDGVSGIWVSSVQTGSPADRAGVKGGDIITMIEGLVLATDGTMSDYCDILRTHGPEDTLSIEVLRYETAEVLEGQLNGRELVVAFSFAQEIEEQIGEDFGEEVVTTYEEYVEVWDDTETLVMEIPLEWSRDVDGSPLLDDDGSYLASIIQASSNLDDFWSTYSTPGVAFYASDLLAEEYDEAGLLDELAEEYDCVYDGRYDYDDGLYTGLYDLYVDCGGVDSVIVELAAVPGHRGFMMYLVIQAVSDADLDALDHILDTFYVAGDLSSGSPGEGSQVVGDQTAALTVINGTGGSVWYIYISPSTSDSWGDDWLGSEVLLAGDSYTFFLAEGTYDLSAADPDGNTVAEEYEVTLSGEMEWTLYPEEGYAALTLINDSDREVCYVRISESVSSEWGDDWLENDTIPAGSSYAFQVPVGRVYDMQALDCDGDVVAEEYVVDIQEDTEWYLTAPAPPESSGPLTFEASWATWPVGEGGRWIIRFTIEAQGGDGHYTYRVSDHTYATNVFDVEWGCSAAFTGDIIVRSGDGQRASTTEWIPVPPGCN